MPRVHRYREARLSSRLTTQRVQVKAAAGLPPVTVWVVRLACYVAGFLGRLLGHVLLRGRGKPYHLWSEGAPRVMLKELHETRG